MARLRVLVPVNGAYSGKLRVKRATGTLDIEGVERVLSTPSVQAIVLARQLQAAGAEIVALHVDRGAGEWVLREALSHGIDQAVLVEGATGYEGDAAARASLIADVYRHYGPFDVVIGPAWSEFGGFTGTLAAVAGQLELPCVVGVRSIATEGFAFRIAYESIFGTYDLRIPRPCVVLAGDLPVEQPTAWGIHDAHRVKGIIRVQADEAALAKPFTKRLRIEGVQEERRTLEQVDGATLVRRMRSRGLIPEKNGKEAKS
jgi:electron transfer flavoprotein alpha/beta subunit